VKVLPVALILLAMVAPDARSQSLDSLPAYKSEQDISGTIRSRGDNFMDPMMKNWEEGFSKYHPDIRFDRDLKSTAHGLPALYFDLTDLALMGREIAPLENLAFRRMFKYDPLAITVATGSYDVPYQTFTLAIFVHKDNPLSKMTLPQLAAVFGCGTGRDIRTWGQLGLTGDWADKPIHVLGYPTGNNIASFFELKVLNSPSSGGPTLPQGVRWNCDMKEYSNIYDEHDRPVTSSDELMMRDLGQDPYAIAYSGVAKKTPQVKTLALAAKAGAPFVEMSPETVANRTYPLTRSLYIYINRAPGKPLDPRVKEFLRYVLSREGQQSVTKQHVFLPLTEEVVREQLKKLE
jgi:phosphate transport system substrate-binding protein